MGAGFGNETTECGRQAHRRSALVREVAMGQESHASVCRFRALAGPDRGAPEFRLVEANHIPQLTAPLPPTAPYNLLINIQISEDAGRCTTTRRGDPTPSRADIDMTRRIIDVAKAAGYRGA